MSATYTEVVWTMSSRNTKSKEKGNSRVKSEMPEERREEDVEESPHDEPEIDLDDEPDESSLIDMKVKAQQDLIMKNTPKTPLEIALHDDLKRKESHIQRLSGEVVKLKAFISKRKQTYKRKRKDEGAPTRALSAYNIFVQDRFSRLAKENEAALKSDDTDAQLKRVPPASLVASTGNQWKELSAEDKLCYEARAKEDRKRYEEQMVKYQPPDKLSNRKRNKTGYNMFFSAHVLRLKQSEAGVPSERGSVARLVGNAWKDLSAEDKQYYERVADKQNGLNSGDEEEPNGKKDIKRRPIPDFPPMQPMQVPMDQASIHRAGGSMPPQIGHAPVVHQPSHTQHDHMRHPPYSQYPPGPQMHSSQHSGYHDYQMQPPPPLNPRQYSASRGGYGYSQGYPSHHYPPYHDGGAGM